MDKPQEELQEVFGNIFDSRGKYEIVIPTNGITRPSGEAVMGAGLALQCKQRIPGFEFKLGSTLIKYGNHVFHFEENHIITFPTKLHYESDSSIDLIIQSLDELKITMDNNLIEKVMMPKIGCGAGNLDWEKEIKPLVVQKFRGDKRLTIVYYK